MLQVRKSHFCGISANFFQCCFISETEVLIFQICFLRTISCKWAYFPTSGNPASSPFSYHNFLAFLTKCSKCQNVKFLTCYFNVSTFWNNFKYLYLFLLKLIFIFSQIAFINPFMSAMLTF